MNRPAAASFALFAGLLLAIGIAVPASAHTELIGVDPGAGTTVAADSPVTLTFSEDLLAIGAEATVTDSSGAVTPLDVTFPTASSAHVVLPSMPGGDVTLAWRVVAKDGHPVEGTLAYVADAPAQASPSATPAPGAAAPTGTTAPVSASATPVSATPRAAPPASAGDSSGFNNVALWLAIFAAVLGSSVAMIAAKRGR